MMDITDYKNYEIDPEWIHVETYDLRDYDGTGGSKYFSQAELIEARELVINKLNDEDVERFTPEILLLEEDKPQKGMIIQVIFDENVRFDGDESRNRTYYIENNKIVKELLGKSKR
jgi:hypothetical protein